MIYHLLEWVKKVFRNLFYLPFSRSSPRTEVFYEVNEPSVRKERTSSNRKRGGSQSKSLLYFKFKVFPFEVSNFFRLKV